MKKRLLLAAAAVFTASVHPLLAGVEVVAGAPATEPVSEPFSVDFDKDGTMYGVEFTKANQIFKVAKGKLSFIAGVKQNTEKEKKALDTSDAKDPLQVSLNGMHDIQIAAGHKAIIGDSFNHVIREMDLTSGAMKTIAGTGKAGFGGDGGPAKAASFNITMTGTLSPDGKRILVADIGNHRVREIDLARGVIRTVAGNGQKGNPTDGVDALQTPMGDARAAPRPALENRPRGQATAKSSA